MSIRDLKVKGGITVGGWIQISLLIFAIVSGWTLVKAKVDQQGEQLYRLTIQKDATTADIAEIRATVAVLAERSRNTDNQLRQVNSKLDQMFQWLKR